MENAGDFAILISSVISSKTLSKQSTGKLKIYEPIRHMPRLLLYPLHLWDTSGVSIRHAENGC
jgi:hypothetical protein